MDRNRFHFFLLTVMLLCARPALSQQSKYWIQFKDRHSSPYSVSRSAEFFSTAAIERRKKYGIAVTASDLPVNPAYVAQVKAIPNTRVRFELKWLNGVVVSFLGQEPDSVTLAKIKALSFVESGSKVRRVRRTGDAPLYDGENQRLSGSANETAFNYGGSASQVNQLNLACLHEKRYRGQGITIAVLDAGFRNVPAQKVFDSLRADGRLLGTRDFVDGGTNAYVGGDHGTMVLSCMAALSPGNAIGTAPLASYWLLRTEEGAAETISEEYNWIRGAEFADSAGADILTTSLGYTTFDDPKQNHSYQTLNGRTAPMSIAATMAARKGLFVLNAAGNDGDKAWRYISVPGDADSICTVGSVNSAGVRSAFSSQGPTSDGRIKPDLVATGEGSWVCSEGPCFPGNGTSFATPILAGAVACYWQANRHLNNIQLLGKLRKNASQANAPDTLKGWGIPNICDSLYPLYEPVPKLPPVPDPYTFEAYAGSQGIVLYLPAAEYESISVQVVDMLGRIVSETSGQGTTDNVFVPVSTLPAGMYVLSVQTSEGSARKKILKLGL